MKSFLSVVFLLSGLVVAGGAAATTVYNETFTGVANGTNLNGIQPTTGQPWSVTTGTQTVSGFAITPGSAAVSSFGLFTNALSSGTLTFSVDFQAITCNASGNNTGVSLFVGASEKIFVGCSGSVNTTLAIGLNGSSASTAVGSGATGSVTITYNYSTGAYSVQAPGGAPVTGTTTAGLAIDRLRVANDAASSGTSSITVTSFLVDLPTPSAVPTLSEWAQLMLALMVIGVAWHFHNNRQNSY